MKHQTIRGKILYTSRKPGREGQERGREHFAMTRHTDGKVTIRAQCEIDEPDPTVLRDAIYSLDEHGRPMDLHLRLTVGDRFMGSGWFRFSEDFIECESYGPSIGRLSQKMPTNGYFDGFGTHPIIGDAYICKVMDVAKGPHKRKLRIFLPSVDHRGATPPQIVESSITLEYVGEEETTTPAGTFACRRFRFLGEDGGMVSKDGEHPTYDMWVTADEHSLFVKGGVGGYMQTWYELVELER
ncbi:DUF3108 domain-containing protein [Caulobacter endophyticus]|uniref:DUF3108 domain-containing protein n=1 Tax=Caulobacter endophyticus TaxID=2172652 RepID=A0A2T9JRV9_9CAUL|nr:hypothetical protein [Caulobacter endophyticus]PVM86440.1 hypothetical protein DDF67_15750 [Caulobacter endophyticus]